MPRPVDIQAVLEKAGSPHTDEEAEADEALWAASIPIWAGKTPPAVPLKVGAPNPRYYKK
jgi:hypothetical protein